MNVASDWASNRNDCFYREDKRHMVHNVRLHGAMPGHYVQLPHHRRFSVRTSRRAAARAGALFVG